MDKIVIIDGNSLFFRAYHAIQNAMMTKDGFPTKGIFGFLNMLFKIQKLYETEYMLIAFDKKEATFRHKEYKDYKANRIKTPDDLLIEIPKMKECLKLLGIKTFELSGFEADDILGTTAKMAKEAGFSCFIVTSDQDALQLVSENCSVVLNKVGLSDFTLFDEKAMKEKFGFWKDAYVDYKALKGDKSDNLEGVPGVGEVTAQKLIKQFGSIENLLLHIDEVKGKGLSEKIKENTEILKRNQHLMRIVCDAPVSFDINDCKILPIDRDGLIEFYSQMEFKRFLAQLQKEEIKQEDKKINIEKLPKINVLSDRAKAIDLLSSCEDLLFSMKSDENHIEKPKLLEFSFLHNDECIFLRFNPEENIEILKEALCGKTLKLKGFLLQKFYYLLLSNGISCENLKPDFDCALAQYVLHTGEKPLSLEALLFEKYHENVEEEKAVQLNLFETSDENLSKTAKKLVLLSHLIEEQKKEIENQDLNKLYYEIELPLCSVLANMENEGFFVDKAILEDFGKDLKQKIKLLEEEIYTLAGESFNINSTKQLGNILFEKLKLPAGKKGKTGYSTDAETLEKLAGDFEICSKILEYRNFNKLNSTYVEGMLPLIGKDGKIHAHFQQNITATGRISCTEPNLQNIPIRQELGKKLREAFVAPSDSILIGADYSQIELRVMASMSQDEALIECFNKGLDIHRETASKIFNVPISEVTDLQRSNAKAVNFGVLYGMSGFGLANSLTISKKDAEKYIQDYFLRFPKVKDFLDTCIEDCKIFGFTKTLYKRKRLIPEIKASSFFTRQLGERLAMNTPIQGTAADIIKIAMLLAYQKLKEECPNSKLILQVHDELIVRARQDEAQKAKEILKEAMENAVSLSVPLDVSIQEGKNWYAL